MNWEHLPSSDQMTGGIADLAIVVVARADPLPAERYPIIHPLPPATEHNSLKRFIFGID